MLGTELGGYRIAKELGAGGMGTVYLAEGPDGAVALKVVHPHLLASPGFFKRFLREAELGRRVLHENVVRTLDVDALVVDGKQVNFMVMEYVEGKSLRDLLQRLGTVPETLLREVAVQAARGLAAIHAADIVHRDLKPENILLTDANEVRIMDLGVAKLQEASIAITKEGQFAGSLLYAAPEQFRKGDVGPAADLYSLGVVLFELATGQNPFRADDAASVIQAHLAETPPRVQERDEDISLFFSEVVATLLAKDPADRLGSAATLADLLEQGEASEWWRERAPKLEKQRAHLPRIRVRRETALHARDDDLAALREMWGSGGRVVLLEGEAGIGKTRLVDELVRTLEGEDAHVLYGSYPPSGGLGAFSDSILDKFGATGLADALSPYLTVTPALVPAFAALVKHEAPPTGAEHLGPEAVQAVAVHLMRALAAEKPTLWVLDDLHFAPKDSRDIVLAMARAAEGHRVLLVLTARPGLPEDELAHLARLDTFERRTLGRLGARDVVELLTDAFKSQDLAERLAGKIAVKSDGVPFFVFEMIRGLKEGRFIRVREDGTYVQTQMITDIEVPSAVKDLIEGRMRGLSEGQRAILDVGAVMGASFEPKVVAEVLEEKKVKVLRELADIERRLGLVRGEAGACRFDQNQIQEVLYQGLMPDLRAEYHTLIADAKPDADAHFLVYHHLRGGEPERAMPHLDAAMKRLEESYRNEEFLDLTERALPVTEGAQRVDVLLRRANLLGFVGRIQDQLATAREARGLADALGDDALRARTLLGIAAGSYAQGEYARARGDALCALELAEAAGDRRLAMIAQRMAGNACSRLGDLDASRQRQERALALAVELGDVDGEAAATINLGIVARDPDEEQRCLTRGLDLARQAGNRVWEANVINNRGVWMSARGHLREALEAYTATLALRREIGHRVGECHVLGNLALLYRRLGRWDRAREHADRFHALAKELDSSRLLAHHAALSAYEAEEREDWEGARRRLDAAIEASGVQSSESAGLLRSRARVRLHEGAVDDARADAERALALDPKHIRALALVARLGGDAAAAEVALEGEADGHSDRLMECRFLLWQATGKREHLEEAHRLLMHMRDHAPEDCRETILENVRLHRAILEAFKG